MEDLSRGRPEDGYRDYGFGVTTLEREKTRENNFPS